MGASDRIEAFLVSSVFAILGIRLFLDLTGYPQVGGDTLHIAHMLWGGLFMLVAIILLLSFVGRATQWTAAILGGLGFGTFIDEVGKFVTKDNDYFYQPAIAIMHVVFVLTYIVARWILTSRSFSKEEYLVNALLEMEELALSDLDGEEKARTLRHLEQADPENPLVPALQQVLADARLVPRGVPPLSIRIKHSWMGLYRRLVSLPGFATALILFFVFRLAVSLYQGTVLILVFGMGMDTVSDLRFAADWVDRLSGLPVTGWGELFASSLSSLFALGGILVLTRSRLRGYYWLQRSVLVSVLLTQVFMFYREQFSAVLGLLINISLLVILDLMIRQEQVLEERDGIAACAARHSEATSLQSSSAPTDSHLSGG